MIIMDITDLEKALSQRDNETIKRLAAIEAKADQSTRMVEESMADFEQKLARVGHGGPIGAPETLGEQFVKAENIQQFLESGASSGKAEMRFKASITSATTDAAGSAGALTSQYRDQGIVGLPQQPLRVRSLLPVIQITQPGVEVMVQKARNLNAAMVAEGAAKPESDLQFELKQFNTRTIAHWMKASRQILDDAPQLRGTIDSELLYGLGLVEDNQLLNGDGTGQNLHGLVPQATAYSAPITMPSPTSIDQIGLAILQASLAGHPADGVVMHPADWMWIRLAKDTTGRYIYGDPSEQVTPRIFGLPIVPTEAMTIDKFLVGQFRTAATVYDRWDARVEVGYVNEDFTKNMVTILAEERLALAVKRPGAMIYGDFGRLA